jgi:hypothetical protein
MLRSNDDLGLVRVAAWSAKSVYASDTDTAHIWHVNQLKDVSDYQPTQHVENIDASFRDGTVKASRIQMFFTLTESSSRLLVVAIRGSTSKRRDWTINFDDIGRGTEGEGFVVSVYNFLRPLNELTLTEWAGFRRMQIPSPWRLS